MSVLRALARATAFVALNLTLVPIYLVAIGFGARPRRWLAALWCRATCAILGVTLRVHGTPFSLCPTLFVANHVSYIDVPVLGALLDARFIAKAEVAGWPLFGQLGQLAQTLFVRRRRSQALVQRNALARAMRAGHSFVLFAEGTSTNGLGILPFKTSLLSVAEPGVVDQPIAIQGVTLAYAAWRNGTPIDQDNCGLYAWFGDTDLLPHLWRVLKAPGVVIAVGIASPMLSWAVNCRKQLGAELQRTIARERELLIRQDFVPLSGQADAAMQHASSPAATAG